MKTDVLFSICTSLTIVTRRMKMHQLQISNIGRTIRIQSLRTNFVSNDEHLLSVAGSTTYFFKLFQKMAKMRGNRNESASATSLVYSAYTSSFHFPLSIEQSLMHASIHASF